MDKREWNLFKFWWFHKQPHRLLRLVQRLLGRNPLPPILRVYRMGPARVSHDVLSEFLLPLRGLQRKRDDPRLPKHRCDPILREHRVSPLAVSGRDKKPHLVQLLLVHPKSESFCADDLVQWCFFTFLVFRTSVLCDYQVSSYLVSCYHPVSYHIFAQIYLQMPSTCRAPSRVR